MGGSAVFLCLNIVAAQIYHNWHKASFVNSLYYAAAPQMFVGTKLNDRAPPLWCRQVLRVILQPNGFPNLKLLAFKQQYFQVFHLLAKPLTGLDTIFLSLMCENCSHRSCGQPVLRHPINQEAIYETKRFPNTG